MTLKSKTWSLNWSSCYSRAHNQHLGGVGATLIINIIIRWAALRFPLSTL